MEAVHSLDLFSVFLLGFFGSAHCLGMCGPLVLTIPATGSSRIQANILYNLGRMTTYGLISLVMAVIGGGLTRMAAGTGTEPLKVLMGVQLFLSFVAAGVLFWLGLMRLRILAEPAWMNRVMPDRFPGFSTIRSGVMVDRSLAACYLYGVFLGFLPCGLSYSAFALALTAAHPLQGGLVGLAFGLGTVPALFLLGTAASGFLLKNRTIFDLLAGMIMIGMALYLVAGGLGRF